MKRRLMMAVYWMLCAAYEVLWEPERSFDPRAHEEGKR